MTLGEKGCFLSHIALWEKCINENLPYLCIFEDDILLSDEAKLFLKDLNWIERDLKLKGSFVIKLETFLMPIEQETISHLPSYQARSLNKLKSVHYGTAGYIISNQATKYFLEYIKTLPLDKVPAIDHVIFDLALSDTNVLVCQLDPAICVQELQLNKKNSKLGSQLSEKRRQVFLANKPKLNLWQKFLREIARIKIRRERKKKMLEKHYRIIEFL